MPSKRPRLHTRPPPVVAFSRGRNGLYSVAAVTVISAVPSRSESARCLHPQFGSSALTRASASYACLTGSNERIRPRYLPSFRSRLPYQPALAPDVEHERDAVPAHDLAPPPVGILPLLSHTDADSIESNFHVGPRRNQLQMQRLERRQQRSPSACGASALPLSDAHGNRDFSGPRIPWAPCGDAPRLPGGAITLGSILGGPTMSAPSATRSMVGGCTRIPRIRPEETTDDELDDRRLWLCTRGWPGRAPGPPRTLHRSIPLARDRRLDRADGVRRRRRREALLALVPELSVPGKPAYEASKRTLDAFGVGVRPPNVVVFHSSRGDVDEEPGDARGDGARGAASPGA